MDLFAKVVKMGLMFKTVRGLVTPQQLWQMPLSGNNGYNLDQVSREVLAEMNTKSESLVTVAKVDVQNELRVEVLKFVIEDLQSELARKEKAKKTRERNQQIAAILERKENASLESMDAADLRKLLQESEDEE